MNSTYKLYYFQVNGRGANTRAILTYAKAQWEDIRIAIKDWPALKNSGKFEFAQLPELELDGGRILTQSLAINVYLARKFNLLGNNEEDEYNIISVLNSVEDWGKMIRQITWPTEEEKSRRAELLKQLEENDIPRFLKIYENRYLSYGGKYFVGDTFSLADIYMANLFHISLGLSLKDEFGHLPQQYAPKLNELVQRVSENELADYFKNVFIHNSHF